MARTLELADKAMADDKRRRESVGKRAGRGEKPAYSAILHKVLADNYLPFGVSGCI